MSISKLAAQAAPSKVVGKDGDVSLLEYLDSSQVHCLNESKDHSIQPIFQTKSKNTSDAYLLSDVDEQLLLNLTFNQTVRIRSIVLQSSSAAQAPKLIKLFINKPSLGFEDVEDASEPEATQVLDLAEGVVAQGTPIPLRYVRFQGVNSLHIFVASNQGGEEETRIDAIDIIGLPVETTNMSGFRKAEEE
ncbi:hypothetical protein BOTBODRAFT_34634 [Botryobasidium botryosum FD-172 SS1]|uniref:PITH domain-containing protein n=1 Tax=Botryobasidium botryosum (strain FD-172 SS1) TaxID=930990 RepID=A0A067MCE7_BOTB1|nr:hypothetical protein BOTBODRAFT_34634 [Botryobasidium botryosum FD-172 SS1]